jgi:Lactoylglutathione lyase and related lyases
MAKSSFIHVGITVSDIQKSIDFYEKYFGFTVEAQFQFPPGFFDAKPTLYALYQGAYSKAAMIKSPDGVTMELFEFDQQVPASAALWNKPGYHHICLKVDDVKEKCREMSADGVELFFEPDYKGPPERNEYWVFLKDPDGNMIELQ